ncbi:MAG TPA: hypothetical protein VGR98_06330 [Streptosporangiaceae bacterium]|nr:hypothetical protein [Streptosporangiaceae bacterium]
MAANGTIAAGTVRDAFEGLAGGGAEQAARQASAAAHAYATDGRVAELTGNRPAMDTDNATAASHGRVIGLHCRRPPAETTLLWRRSPDACHDR